MALVASSIRRSALGVACRPTRAGDAVAEVLVEQAERPRSAGPSWRRETWVRMSMQYSSLSTIRCSPRIWPSMRRSRFR